MNKIDMKDCMGPDADVAWLLRQLHATQEELQLFYLGISGGASSGSGTAISELLAQTQSELADRTKRLGEAVEKLSKAELAAASATQGLAVSERIVATQHEELKEAKAAVKAASSQIAVLKDQVSKGEELLTRMHDEKAKVEELQLEKIAALQQQLEAERKGRVEAERILEITKSQLACLQSEHSSLLKSHEELDEKSAASERGRSQSRLDQADLVSDVRAENELLLEQMHMVQEELERYFLENRELQAVAESSCASMERARHVISRMMNGGA